MSMAVTANPTRASGIDWKPQPAPRSIARREPRGTTPRVAKNSVKRASAGSKPPYIHA
jgi:hypothetical protein